MSNKLRSSQIRTADFDGILTGATNVQLALDTLDEHVQPVELGGTGLTSYAAGDIIYAVDETTLATLPVGSDNQILSCFDGDVFWTTSYLNPQVFDGYFSKSEIGAIFDGYDGYYDGYYNKNDIDLFFDGYYNKFEIDSILDGYYNKGEIGSILDGYLSELPNGLLDGYYNQTQINSFFDGYYNKGEIGSILDGYLSELPNGLLDGYYNQTQINSFFDGYYNKNDLLDGWTLFDFSFTRLEDGYFSVEDTPLNAGIFTKGRPLRYGYSNEFGSFDVFGIVDNVVEDEGNLIVYLFGAPMTTEYDSYLYYSLTKTVKEQSFTLDGYYALSVTTSNLLESYKKKFWMQNDCYLLGMSCVHLADNTTGANPNLYCAGVYVDFVETTLNSSGINVNINGYFISGGSFIEIECVSPDAGVDICTASDLTVKFVLLENEYVFIPGF